MKETPVITKQQLDILKLLYRFRFVNSRQVQLNLNQKNQRQARRALDALLRRQYIGRRYSAEDSLRGRYATYFLRSEGIRLLRGHQPGVSSRILHNIHKDQKASNKFARHQLGVGDCDLEFARLYGDRLEFFTRSELADYDYLLSPPPDAFMRLREGAVIKRFFLECYESNTPFSVLQQRVRAYLDYAGEGVWEDATDTKLPAVLAVCESKALQHKLLKAIRREFSYGSAATLPIYTTTKQLLGAASSHSAIWRAA